MRVIICDICGIQWDSSWDNWQFDGKGLVDFRRGMDLCLNCNEILNKVIAEHRAKGDEEVKRRVEKEIDRMTNLHKNPNAVADRKGKK